jgi:hypothetical protein
VHFYTSLLSPNQSVATALNGDDQMLQRLDVPQHGSRANDGRVEALDSVLDILACILL